MPRYTVHRVDRNQPEIVEEFESHGATVTPLSGVGSGVADLLVGYRGFTIPVEVKVPDGKMNEKQIHWHSTFDGVTAVVRTISQAAFLINVIDSVCERFGIYSLSLETSALEPEMIEEITPDAS